MTTFDERLRALGWGQQLLEELAAAQAPTPEQELATWLCMHYPAVAAIQGRLEACGGYALMLAARSFDRTAGLLERLALEADENLRDRAAHIARHFPHRRELALAVRSPYDARVWAAMHLDRSPGRSALLRFDPPALSALQAASKHQRRRALRQLATELQLLQRDSMLTAFASGQIRQSLEALPGRQLLARRFAGEDLQAVNQHLRALQQACLVVEAVADGTFATSLRSQGRAMRLLHGLPAGNWFALTAINEEDRQAWVDELFLRRPPRGRREADPVAEGESPPPDTRSTPRGPARDRTLKTRRYRRDPTPTDLDLEPALRQMHQWGLDDGDIGYAYWHAVMQLLRAACGLDARALTTGTDAKSATRRTWNYRVMRFESGEDAWEAIHEVHYDGGRLVAYSAEPAVAMWNETDKPLGALRCLARMKEALSKPVLTEAMFKRAPGESDPVWP